MQALATTFVLASALLLGATAPSLAAKQEGPGHLSSIVEIVETTGSFLPTHRASGVLLTPRIILSTKKAADKPGFAKGRHVVVGRSGHEGVKVQIKSRFEYEDHQILVLKLQEAVNLTAWIKPANLPYQSSDNTGASAMLATWTGSKAETLKSSTVNVLSKEECAKKDVADGLLCSEDHGVEACNGDEGSPLVQDLKNGVYKLVGLVTGVQDAKECATTITYLDVAQYSTWILDQIYSDGLTESEDDQ